MWYMFEFEWGFYALSASKAIFRARKYDCITYIQSGDDDYLMNEIRRKPTTGRQFPSLTINSFRCRQGHGLRTRWNP